MNEFYICSSAMYSLQFCLDFSDFTVSALVIEREIQSWQSGSNFLGRRLGAKNCAHGKDRILYRLNV